MRRTLVACLALALAAPPASAGKEPPRPARIEFGAAVTVVTVPVFVTDRRSHPVTGLKAEDFEVSDEGKRMDVVGFQEIDIASPEYQAQVRDAPAARRQFLLFFDLSFTGVAGLLRARDAARQFVAMQLQPHDLCAVATFSANYGVKLLVGFTSDRGQLRRAVETLGVLQLDRKADPLGLTFDLTELGGALADTRPRETGQEFEDAARAIQIRYEQAEKESYRQRVMALFDGMGQLAKALDAVQGRKQVIFFSSGFSSTSLYGEQAQQQAEDSEAIIRGHLWEVQTEDRFGDAGVRNEMEAALKFFSTSDAVIHAVDLSGLSARGDPRMRGTEPRRNTGQDSLARVADIGGGRLFKDANDVGRALGEILDMSRHYYLLAFEPRQAKGPGKFHQLKVRVNGKGMEVSHRSGYFERSAYQARSPLAKRFEAAEVIAKGVTGGEIDLRALAVPYRNAGGQVTLPVVLEIEGSSLLKRGPGTSLGLEVYGYALDAEGGIEDVAGLVTNLSLPQVGRKISERGIQCHLAFTLPPGKHSLRFLVRDAETGRSGAHWLEVNIPAFESGGVLLYPPLFMDDPGQWLILQATSKSTTSLESPFKVASDLFTPRTRPRLVNGRAESVCLMAYDGGALYDPGASFEIKAQLINHDGLPVPFGRLQIARSTVAEGFRRFVMNFTPTDVLAGAYTFRVRLRDPASGQVSEAFQAVHVE